MACYNICPKNAIEMKADEEGFWYPKIHRDKCIDCHLCRNACPSINNCKNSESSISPKVYAAYSLNEETRIKSTSGGLFSELASLVLDHQGYVAGAIYNEKHQVEHYIAKTKEELIKLRQSKYVQSDMGSVYKEIKNLLQADKLVLFCGTPCQNAGLTCFLGEKYEKLILCDFICRGNASPKAYEAYLEMQRNKYKSQIKQVNFKNKTYGWSKCSILVTFENGEEYLETGDKDPYVSGYINTDYFFRPSCFNCKYKKLPRVSDITLADFWGIGKTRPYLDQDKGTSLVLINSDKGRKLLEEIKERLTIEECSFEEAINGDGSIFDSVKKSSKRKKFYVDLDAMSFDKLMEKYSKQAMNIALKNKFKNSLLRLRKIV
jgi:coenzyme F420-reducing hydrogenase beta subunit